MINKRKKLRALSEGLGRRNWGKGKPWRLKTKQPPETAELQGAMGGRDKQSGPSYLHGPASGQALWEIKRSIRPGLCSQR